MIIGNAQITLGVESSYSKSTERSINSQLLSPVNSDAQTVVTTNGTYNAIEQTSQFQQQNTNSQITSLDGSHIKLTHNQKAASINESSHNGFISLHMLRQIRLGAENSPSTNAIENLSESLFSINQVYRELEQEKLAFNAQGDVSLQDGRQIQFNFNQIWERSYFIEEFIELSRQEAIFTDPLVLTFDAQLSPHLTSVLGNNQFDIDMNLDGQNEQLTFVAPGSGFLVLDRNQDGQISHGGEMFGGVTGNGFQELAQFDTDGNHWIDENDDVFAHLQIWTENTNGERTLLSLKDAGIGAIYLNSARGEFSFTDQHNNALGKIKSSGVFLKENGEAGGIVQIDLAKLSNRANNRQSMTDQANSESLTTIPARNNVSSPMKFTPASTLPEWLSTEEGLEALNDFINKLASGEASLADIGLFLSPGSRTMLPGNNDAISVDDVSPSMKETPSVEPVRVVEIREPHQANNPRLNKALSGLARSEQIMKLLDIQA